MTPTGRQHQQTYAALRELHAQALVNTFVLIHSWLHETDRKTAPSRVPLSSKRAVTHMVHAKEEEASEKCTHSKHSL